MSLSFPRTPGAPVGDLWRACLELVPQLERRVIYGVTIGTTSTSVSHGLGYVPKIAIPVPRADARVWRSADPDTERVYFAASAAVVCDIEVVA